jgi:hypothetical protein
MQRDKKMLQFSGDTDKNLYFNLKGLCNKNNGLFKSLKQAKFLFGTYSKQFNNTWTRDQFFNNFGVAIPQDQIGVVVTAHTRWADYGTRSIIPVLYIFVLDKVGIVSAWKVNGNGNLRDGWAPDPQKAITTWARPLDLVLPDYDKATEDTPPAKISGWIGEVGQKVNIQAKIIRARDLGIGRFGAMFITTLEDVNGNVINVWRNLGQIGDSLELKGTVKDCNLYNEVKQTTLTRVSVVK